jgi:hypothetical protein
MAEKCPFDIGGVCQSMMCLEKTECGSRDAKGAPNYSYYDSRPAKRKAGK